METIGRNRHSDPLVRRPSALRSLKVAALGLLALAAVGCGELEPIVEPEIVDLQLTLDTLRTQLRDAQRSLAEARAELESRRQELADAQVARAQLEGRVREAERRVSEARRVIEVQREELLAARMERERVYRSSSHLQNQMRQLQRKTAKPSVPPIADQTEQASPTGAAYPWSFETPLPAATTAINAVPGRRSATRAAMGQGAAREIVVKPGDTLWSLAHAYRINLNRLMSINHLTDDQIEVGQVLLLSENRVLTDPSLTPDR